MTAAGRLVGLCAWLVLGTVALVVDGLFSDSLVAVEAASISMLCFGVWAFLYHGGPQVSAAGLFCGATSAFIGFAGLWWSDRLGVNVPEEMLWGVTSSYFATVLMFYLFWWGTRASFTPPKRDYSIARWAVGLGVCLTATGLAIYLLVEQSFRPAARGLATVGIILLVIGMVGTHQSNRFPTGRLLMVGALLVSYVAIAFTGYGRLPVIALVAAIAVCVSVHQRSRVLKVMAVLFVPVAVAVLSSLRSVRLRPRFGTTGSPDTPDSAVSGLETFSRMLSSGENLEFGYGETFWATLVIWFPRDLWEDKPFGFGFDLTLLLEPQLAAIGHSMVATVFGEWYYNFGWLGLLLCIVFVGLFVRILDVARKHLFGSRLDKRRDMLFATLFASLIGSMGDFVWAGTFTLADRMLYRVITVGLLLCIVVVTTSRSNTVAKRSHAGVVV